MKTMLLKIRFLCQQILLVVLLFFSSSAFGQDFIRGTDEFDLCDTSIVRETSKDTVLIYNYHNKATFMRVVDGATYVTTMYVEDLHVKDFEVLNNMVYFCGYINDNNSKVAVIGYFNLNYFPNSNVYCYVIKECKEFRKLDIYQIVEYQFEKETHLVLTGTTTGTRSDILVDMTMFASPVINTFYQISYDGNESFDDVAVTKNYVVVSSRNNACGFPIVKLWYYDRPLSLGLNIFTSNINSFQINSPLAETPVLLEYTNIDSIAAVYKVNGYSRMAMLTLDVAGSDYKCFEIMGDKMKTVYPMDIKYNTRNGVYAILAKNINAREEPTFDPPMQIYHISRSDLIGSTPYGHGRTYFDNYYHLWSLEPLSKTANKFVVSAGWGQLPRLLRFDHYQFGPCLDYFDYNYYITLFKGEKQNEDISISFFTPEFKSFDTWYLSFPFPPKCPTE